MNDDRLASHLAEAEAAMGRGRFPEAEMLLQRALQSRPDAWQAHFGLGWLRLRDGRLAQALDHLGRAAASRPRDVAVARPYAEALAAAGRLGEAEAVLAGLMMGGPASADIHWRRAILLRDLGRTAASEVQLDAALRLDPALAGAQCDLGLIALDRRDLGRAAAAFARALAADPALGDAHANLGVVRQQTGRLSAAAACYRRSLTLRSDQPLLHSNLALLYSQMKDHAAAERHARISVRLGPDNLDLHVNHVVVLAAARHFARAFALARAIVATWPGEPAAYAILSGAHETASEITTAAFFARWAALLAPNAPEPHVRVASLLHLRGRHAEAAAAYRRAYACPGGDTLDQSPLIYVEGYGAVTPPAEQRRRAEAWFDRRYGGLPRPAPFGNARAPGKRLRVGYVSPDLRMHAVGFFIGPVLAHHDRDQVEVVAYATGPSDDVTARLRPLTDRWRDVMGFDDETLHRRIRDDGIDILVDLSGLLMRHSQGVFARRAAPVQVCYLGYFGTTGNRNIDYWLSDEVLHPSDSPETMTETIWRLPRCWVAYDPWPQGPAVRHPRPGPGYDLTFGSFNSTAKLTAETIALWACVLAAVPGARLLLKSVTLDGPADHAALRGAFARHGVAPERIAFLPPTPDYAAHLDLYGEVDIVLDPIPFSGGTTTADALWMGAPVLTLRGDRMMGRMSASMLTTLGMDGWIAETADDFVARAVRWASDSDGRHSLREKQRAVMQGSDLVDGRSLAQAIDRAYRDMWRAWAAGGS